MPLRLNLALALATTALLAGGAPACHATEPAPSAPSALAGPRKTVLVDVAGAAEAMPGSMQSMGTTHEALNAMLVDALFRSGRFVVAERERFALSDMQMEQNLGAARAATAETAARPGEMLGASAIVRATVTKFQQGARGTGAQVGVFGLGGLLAGMAGVSEQEAIVEFNLRVVDTSTGEVLLVSKAAGTARSSNANVTATALSGLSAGANRFRNTPLGAAAQVAIEEGVRKIVAAMDKVPWSALVAAFEEGKVYINAGASSEVKPGTNLKVYRKGRVLTDPGSGAVIHVQLTEVGKIQILSVAEKVSIATLIDGQPPARGDVVRQE